MSLISFRNIKLFKSAAQPSKRERKPPLPQKEEKAPFGQNLLQNPFILTFVFALVLAYLIAYVPSKSLPELKAGEIATSDIVAPADLTIEDTETTEKRRQDAADAVLPVYVFDANVPLNTEEKIRQFFAGGREWMQAVPAKKDYVDLQKTAMDRFGIELAPRDFMALEKEAFGSDLEAILIELLEKYSAQGILLSKSLLLHREQERGLTLLRTQEGEKTIRAQDIFDVKEAKDKFVAEINALELPARKKGLLLSLAFGFVAPNISFSKAETDSRKEKARAGVEKVFYTIKKGKVLIRKGDEAVHKALKQISSVNQNLKTKSPWLTNFVGTFIIYGLLLVTLWFYLKSLLSQRQALKYFMMMGITLILSLVMYKVFLFLAGTSSQNARFFLFTDAESYKFAFPYQFGVILFAFLTTNTVALIFSILNSLIAGYLFGANYFLLLFSLIGGLAAIYGIKYYQKQKRTSTLRAGFFLVAPLNIIVVLTFTLIRERWIAPDILTAEVFMGIAGGALSAALAFVGLPIYEDLFGFVTQTKLLDLSNSDSEIFRRMAMEAPGSYHHSLIVASLAEKAAEAIKADSLFVKTGALYHDIGKLKMPEYFIENKDKKTDVHKDLTPSMSTLVIVNHVKEGVEIAKKEKLPQQLREIIEQHHGSSVVRFFYQKAKEKYDPEMQKIGEESYRYPGPPPQSKEAALVMLADSVEAASRSLKVHREENLKRVIRVIFDNYLQDGQLDDCNFSLKELRTIASSFFATLTTVYQRRIEYPGFDFEIEKKKKAEKNHKKDNDRSHQPPEEIPD
jgi:putative nucleotidyltransferase with HDIG domain